MRSSQSSDQFIAGAWTGGKVSALPALPRHPRGTAFHERSRLSARQILSARVGHDHVQSSPHKPPHCALSNAHALSVRTSTYPRPSNICAIHDNVNGLSFYDNEGNLTKKSRATGETWYYGYDNRNHLTSAKQEATDGGTLWMQATYVYDARGDRLEKDVWTSTNGLTTSRFAYDNGNVWADLNS